MEIRARYFLIGLFVLAVIGAGVGFIFWLYNNGGLVKRTDYLVSFNGSVSGLSPGSPVLFNGLQVGEVTGLTLSTDDPELVLARIAIDARTPVHTDTYVGMDFRGLTGTATISLKGGTASAPMPEGINGGPPLLVADPNGSKDLTTSAREALNQLNDILTENAEPVTSAIASIDTFAQALARNSDKIDSIVAGLEGMVGGGKKPETINYDLTAAGDFGDIAAYPDAQLMIPSPTTVIALDTQRIMITSKNGTSAAFDGTRWADSIPLLTQARLIQSFENAGYPRVGSDTGGVNGDFQLLVNIRAFDLDTTSGTPEAKVALMGKILDVGGKVIDARLFEASAPATEIDKAEPVAKSINEAFGKVMKDLVVWTLETLANDEGAGGGDSAEAPPPLAMPEPPAPAGDAAAPEMKEPAPAAKAQ